MIRYQKHYGQYIVEQACIPHGNGFFKIWVTDKKGHKSRVIDHALTMKRAREIIRAQG